MTVQTFIIEWDTDVLCTMVVAEETLKQKAAELRKMKLALADQEYDKWVGVANESV